MDRIRSRRRRRDAWRPDGLHARPHQGTGRVGAMGLRATPIRKASRAPRVLLRALRRRDGVRRPLRRSRTRVRSVRGGVIRHATAQFRGDRGSRRTGLGLVHGRPRLYRGLELAAHRQIAPVAQHRHHRIGYPDRHHGRAVAIGCPPPDRDRRLLESAFHRALGLQPQSFRRFRPRPPVAAQLPRPPSHGRLDRDRRAVPGCSAGS